MKKFKVFFKYINSYISGDIAYQKYLEHLQKNHKNFVIISKKEFLNNKRNKKWDNINRCC